MPLACGVHMVSDLLFMCLCASGINGRIRLVFRPPLPPAWSAPKWLRRQEESLELREELKGLACEYQDHGDRLPDVLRDFLNAEYPDLASDSDPSDIEASSESESDSESELDDEVDTSDSEDDAGDVHAKAAAPACTEQKDCYRAMQSRRSTRCSSCKHAVQRRDVARLRRIQSRQSYLS